MTDLLINTIKRTLILLFLLATSCSYLTSSVTNEFGNNLKSAMLNHNDPQTVAEAIPAYLMLQESLLVNDPDNEELLMSTASLYSSYINLADKIDPSRKQRLSQKAFDLALHGSCLYKDNFCQLNEKNFNDFTKIIDRTNLDDLDSLYGLGSSWVNWIQANKADWSAVAQLAQVKYLMNHVVSIKEDHNQGAAYLYLGVMECIVPPALGGKPDIAKQNFEKAMELSNKKNLMVQVLYARHYARLMFKRDLHDTLLNEVINGEVEQQGLTLSNSLAFQQAKKLLQSAEEYF